MIESLHIQGSPFDIQIATEPTSDSSDSVALLVSSCEHDY